MKRKNLLSLLPLVLLLSSCQSVNTEEVFNQAKEAVSQLGEVSYTGYDINVAGHVLQFDRFDTEAATGLIPDDDITNTTRNRSLIYRVPLRLSEANFYPEEVEEGQNLDNYTYTRLNTRLTGQDDPVTRMQFKKDGDNLVFYCTGLSRRLTFYNVYLYDIEGWPVYSTVTVYSRFNVNLTYNNQGLLIKEDVKNIIVDSTENKDVVDIVTEYNYTA